VRAACEMVLPLRCSASWAVGRSPWRRTSTSEKCETDPRDFPLGVGPGLSSQIWHPFDELDESFVPVHPINNFVSLHQAGRARALHFHRRSEEKRISAYCSTCVLSPADGAPRFGHRTHTSLRNERRVLHCLAMVAPDTASWNLPCAVPYPIGGGFVRSSLAPNRMYVTWERAASGLSVRACVGGRYK
jgi:hypothetical protein